MNEIYARLQAMLAEDAADPDAFLALLDDWEDAPEQLRPSGQRLDPKERLREKPWWDDHRRWGRWAVFFRMRWASNEAAVDTVLPWLLHHHGWLPDGIDLGDADPGFFRAVTWGLLGARDGTEALKRLALEPPVAATVGRAIGAWLARGPTKASKVLNVLVAVSNVHDREPDVAIAALEGATHPMADGLLALYGIEGHGSDYVTWLASDTDPWGCSQVIYPVMKRLDAVPDTFPLEAWLDHHDPHPGAIAFTGIANEPAVQEHLRGHLLRGQLGDDLDAALEAAGLLAEHGVHAHHPEVATAAVEVLRQRGYKSMRDSRLCEATRRLARAQPPIEGVLDALFELTLEEPRALDWVDEAIGQLAPFAERDAVRSWVERFLDLAAAQPIERRPGKGGRHWHRMAPIRPLEPIVETVNDAGLTERYRAMVGATHAAEAK